MEEHLKYAEPEEREPVKDQEPHWMDKIDNRHARRRRAAMDRRA